MVLQNGKVDKRLLSVDNSKMALQSNVSVRYHRKLEKIYGVEISECFKNPLDSANPGDKPEC